MAYKRYEKYKDSGVEWLGEIPENWGYGSFRRYTYLQQGLQIAQDKRFHKYEDGRLVYLTVKFLNSKNKQNEIEYIEGASDSVICNKDDVLLGRTGSTGKVVTNAEGVFHNNFFKINYDKKNLNKEFLVYYLTQNNIQEHFKLVSGTTTIPDLNHGEFLSTKLVVPSIKEQKQIVDFLDKKTIKIDTLIQDKENLIELLKEQRQAIITDAVTKGLDKNASMKDSGVEWIGEIPNGWKTRRLKYNCYMKGRIGWQGLKQSEFIDEGPFLITGMNFKEGKINWDEVYHISEERYNEAPEIQLREGDVLITKDGTIGKVLFIDILPDKASLNSHLLVMRCKNNDFRPKYLYYSLQAEYFKMYVEQVKTGTTFFGITQEAMSNFPLILPPLNEQDKIVEAIESDLNKIDSLVDDVKTGINNLMEYKQSLISEVVTGKINILGE